MREKKYEIPMQPVPLQRPRASFKGGHHFFDPQARLKATLGIYLHRLHNNEPKFIGPLFVEAIFYLPKPQNKKEKYHELYHFRRPDLDNFLKFVLDVITSTEVIWDDDSQVSEIHTKKHYAKKPHMEITIRELL